MKQPSTDTDTLLALYGQICDSLRMLTDVRFKLLALLPPIAGLGLFAVTSRKGIFEGARVEVRVAAAVFGLLVSAGLYIYDRRNSELYNDLISRGRRAEEDLGVDTGVFLGRLNPRSALVRHGTATKLIYGTVLLSWLAAVLWLLIRS